ncbi:MAG: hypothetical protein ACT4PZ_19745 [Panacagrimonas sp.]
MSQILLDGELLRDVLQARFSGGADDFTSHWDADGSLAPSTVWRWTQGQVPRTGDDLLKLSALLDLDPFCLLTCEPGREREMIEALLSRAERGQWDRFRFFAEFFGRQRKWPPEQIAQAYPDARWHTAEFRHDAEGRSNYYPLFRLSPDRRRRIDLFPQVYHFAFRNPASFAGRWLGYGMVVHHGLAVRLRHIDGQAHAYTAANTNEPARVETFFGPGPGEFRIASLHPFRGEIEHEPEPSLCVRFRG